MTENQRLKIKSKFLKVTQLDFGSSLGLTLARYSDIERGKNKVSKKIKILLKKETHINLSWLETGEGEMIAITMKRTKDFILRSFPTVRTYLKTFNQKSKD